MKRPGDGRHGFKWQVTGRLVIEGVPFSDWTYCGDFFSKAAATSRAGILRRTFQNFVGWEFDAIVSELAEPVIT